jgi:hypothetical protein
MHPKLLCRANALSALVHVITTPACRVVPCAVLLQLALFKSHSSRHAAGGTAQQQQQQHAAATSAAAGSVVLTTEPAAADEHAATGQGQVVRRQNALPAAVQVAHRLQGKTASVRQQSSSSNTKQVAAEAAATGSTVQASTGCADTKSSQQPPSAAPAAAVDAHRTLPPLTSSLLDFNVWATSVCTAAGSSALGCGQAAAATAAAVYSEPGWLEDLQLLLPQAQQHL